MNTNFFLAAIIAISAAARRTSLPGHRGGGIAKAGVCFVLSLRSPPNTGTNLVIVQDFRK